MRSIVGSREQWLEARLELLAEEKELTRRGDEIARKRRALPWVVVAKDYRFLDGADDIGLSELFGRHSQLVVHHLMFAPDWEQACKSCSFWADSYSGALVHLSHRDVAFVAVSRATPAQIQQYRERMGWTFRWVSSCDDFNYDFQASFTAAEVESGRAYQNYRLNEIGSTDDVAFSVFAKDEMGNVFHTYSCYQRGIESLNNAYSFLDLVPKGRDEDGFSFPMTWVRRHDQY